MVSSAGVRTGASRSSLTHSHFLILRGSICTTYAIDWNTTRIYDTRTTPQRTLSRQHLWLIGSENEGMIRRSPRKRSVSRRFIRIEDLEAYNSTRISDFLAPFRMRRLVHG